MLRNISGELVTVKYNGIILAVPDGEELNVRDFGIDPKHTKAVQNHIIAKNPVNGKSAFAVEDRAMDDVTSRDAQKLLDDSEKKIKELSAEIEKKQKAFDANQSKIVQMGNDIDRLGRDNQALREENKDLKARLEAEIFPNNKKKK